MTYQLTSERVENVEFIELAISRGISFLRSMGVRRNDARLLAGMNDQTLAGMGLRREEVRGEDGLRW
ncbi:MAG: hypothetical protein ACREDN_01300 [Aestuariivirga sp.]